MAGANNGGLNDQSNHDFDLRPSELIERACNWYTSQVEMQGYSTTNYVSTGEHFVMEKTDLLRDAISVRTQ